MNTIITGEQYIKFLEEGESLDELATRLKISPVNINNSIRRYQNHIVLYNTDEVYRRLYGNCCKLFRNENFMGLLTRTRNALRRAGLETVESIEENKDRIIKNLIRNIGTKSTELIAYTFFNNTSWVDRNEKYLYADALHETFDISKSVVDTYFNNRTVLTERATRRIDLALLYLRDKDNSSSKYSRACTYIEAALQNIRSLDDMELFYKNLAKLGTADTLTIVKYAISRI